MQSAFAKKLNYHRPKPINVKIPRSLFSLSPGGDYVTSPFMVRQAHHAWNRGALKINELAVLPERVEGRMANCDTVSKGEGDANYFLSPAGRATVFKVKNYFTKNQRTNTYDF